MKKKFFYYVSATIKNNGGGSPHKRNYVLNFTQSRKEKDEDFFIEIPNLIEEEIKKRFAGEMKLTFPSFRESHIAYMDLGISKLN